ncbi:MAG: carbohydrate binding domain-containing protein [Pyrinomonadaceae bacterium]
MAVSSVYAGNWIGRVLTLVAVLLALFLNGVAVKWFFGNSISTQAQTIEVANVAEVLSPKDPQTHFALSVLLQRSFIPSDEPKSLHELEIAAALSPWDFQIWLDLGQARERNGDVAGMFKAFEQAQKLAPNNSEVMWTLGNALIRQQKTNEAFVQIKRVVEIDPTYAGAAANLAWALYDGDLAKVRSIVGNSHAVNSALATSLARSKDYEAAFELWKSIPPELARDSLRKDSELLEQTFQNALEYQKALQILAVLANEGERTFKFGEITNGGFEEDVKTDKAEVFEWNLDTGVQPIINVDEAVKHSGSRSLLLVFSSTKRDEFRIVKQNIGVAGGKSYTLSFFYKSELDSDNTVEWEVVDLNASGVPVLANSKPLAAKTDWQKVDVSFDVPEGADAIQIRLSRTGCASDVCPLHGKIWFDDFKLS